MNNGRGAKQIVFILAFSLVAGIWAPRSFSAAPTTGWKGQTVYVPTYSYIYYGDKGRTFNLTTTLSIRNTDQSSEIKLISVLYYDSTGKMVREYTKGPVTLGPLASTHFLVDESDMSGGVEASFIVEWSSAKVVSEPVIEAVMIGAGSTQGISFVSAGRPLSGVISQK